MSDEKKAAADEGQQRLMAFATGIGRFCEDANIQYGNLAKQAGVSDEMLAPVLAEVVIDAAQRAE